MRKYDVNRCWTVPTMGTWLIGVLHLRMQLTRIERTAWENKSMQGRGFQCWMFVTMIVSNVEQSQFDLSLPFDLLFIHQTQKKSQRWLKHCGALVRLSNINEFRHHRDASDSVDELENSPSFCSPTTQKTYEAIAEKYSTASSCTEVSRVVDLEALSVEVSISFVDLRWRRKRIRFVWLSIKSISLARWVVVI